MSAYNGYECGTCYRKFSDANDVLKHQQIYKGTCKEPEHIEPKVIARPEWLSEELLINADQAAKEREKRRLANVGRLILLIPLAIIISIVISWNLSLSKFWFVLLISIGVAIVINSLFNIRK
jgi:hypothetical protein